MRDPLPLGVVEPEPKEDVTTRSNSGAVSDDNTPTPSDPTIPYVPDHSTHNSSGGDDLPPPSYDLAMMTDPRLEGSGRERSDSDLAKELSERLNVE